MLAEQGIESVKLPPRSPNLNAYAERFVRTIKENCLDQMILFGEDALRKEVHEFLAHYHHERNHQGLDNRLLIGATTVKAMAGSVRKRERLGGLLNYYYREAANIGWPDTTRNRNSSTASNKCLLIYR
jgi:transposase InsO family protein